MQFAPSCTDVEYCCYTIHVESSYLGHSREYSILYKNEFPVCVLEPTPPYFMLAGLFDLKKHVFRPRKSWWGVGGVLYKMENLSSTCYVFRIVSRDILVLLLRWWHRESFQVLFFGTRLHPHVPV